METNIEEKMTTDKTLSDDPRSISEPSLEESVVVTTTVVETTEVSVVQTVQKDDEFMKDHVEGLFGNLVGEDEGLKVNSSENGTSVGMDVDGSLEGENGSCLEPVIEGKTVKDYRNAGGDPMDIFSFGENEENDDNRAEILESKEDMNKKVDDESVKNREDNGKEVADHDVEDHNFVVGDFVWGKIKSHPWWPGQIYDPSDASDYANTVERKGQLLVAYFGDKSFSWSSPSQLKPFIDNFKEMTSQIYSKKFSNAVQKGLEEVSRLVEAELTCKCQPVKINKKGRVVNRGIKEGACVPKGNTIKVLVDRIEPVELVSTLKSYASMEPGTRLFDLELTVLKSCLRAFYTKKGGSLLVDYRYPKFIEGLEEKTRSGVVADYDINGPSGSPGNGDGKLYQKRKKKSVAELLGEDESQTKTKKGKTSKGGRMKGRKKVLVVSVTHESDHESGDGGGGVEEETISSRQRKKSRYLSPPYLSPVGSGRLSVLGSGSFKESKTEPEKVPEIDAKQLEDTLKKSSGKKTRRVGEVSNFQEHKKTDAAVTATIVLSRLLLAALDPSSFVEENLPEITEFVSSFRSSTFKEGTCNQTDTKKDGEDTSELAFIKQKLEWMNEMVHACEESDMSSDVKASLEGGIQQVLEKVVKMRGE